MYNITIEKIKEFFKTHDDMRIVLVFVACKFGNRRNPLTYSTSRQIRSYNSLTRMSYEILIDKMFRKYFIKDRAIYEKKLHEREIKLSKLTKLQQIKKAFKGQTLIALEPCQMNELECCGEVMICDKRKCLDKYKIKF